MYFLRPPLTEAAHCYKNKPRAKLSHEAEKTIKKDLSESRESFSAIFVLGQVHLRQSDLKTAKMAEKIKNE